MKKVLLVLAVVLMFTLMFSSLSFAAVKVEAIEFTPKIDGAVDGGWASATAVSPANKVKGDVKATAQFKTAWDANNLYVLAVVKDPVVSTKNEKVWEQDSVEFFLNGLNDLTLEYGADDAQYRINPDGKLSGGGTGYKEENLAAYKAVKTSDGYIVEAAIKWAAHGVTGVKAGFVAGIEFQLNDDDGSAKKTSQYNWSARENNAYMDPSVFGEVTLKAAPAAAPATDTAPAATTNPKTADSSSVALMVMIASAAVLVALYRKSAIAKK